MHVHRNEDYQPQLLPFGPSLIWSNLRSDLPIYRAAFLRFSDCDVRKLAENDQQAYTQKRLAGGITCSEVRETEAVRSRSVEADLKLLHTMLRWACTVRVRGGQRLLESNPLDGLRRPREQNPRRPVATYDRFQKTRAAIQCLATESTTDAERRK